MKGGKSYVHIILKVTVTFIDKEKFLYKVIFLLYFKGLIMVAIYGRIPPSYRMFSGVYVFVVSFC